MIEHIFVAVRERPIDEKPSAAPTCPFCASADVEHHEKIRTLIGGGDGTVDGDPNHIWHQCHCRTCHAGFTRETKDGNVWYTAGGRTIVRGLPSCFERYDYTCARCAGALTRRFTLLDGATPTDWCGSGIKDGQWINFYRVFFECAACGAVTETASDHWNGRPLVP